jgi:hypothetical protein
MCRQFPAVTVALAALLAFAAEGKAHRLEAGYKVLPGRTVRVQSWFETGDPAASARVAVLREDGTELVAGRLSSQGLFLFEAKEEGPLKVMIDAGDGHAAELTIPAAELADPGAKPATPPREPPLHLKDIVTGVAFVLAAAAFVLSLRNAQRLRDVEARRRG